MGFVVDMWLPTLGWGWRYDLPKQITSMPQQRPDGPSKISRQIFARATIGLPRVEARREQEKSTQTGCGGNEVEIFAPKPGEKACHHDKRLLVVVMQKQDVALTHSACDISGDIGSAPV